jgi:malate dehydrogenase
MSKITVVGAGNVGATCANVLAHADTVNEVVLIDIQGNMAKGKALDMWQQAPIDGYSTRVSGGDDYALTAGSDIVIITAGIPRKPGMSRDDLIATNAKIVVSVTENILKHTKNPIIIVVSNPLDVMTYACWKASGLSDKRVLGMAGVLDTARYRAFLAEALDISPKDIQAVLMGGHGDTMVPLPRYTTVSGIPVTELIRKDKLDAILERTKVGGGGIGEPDGHFSMVCSRRSCSPNGAFYSEGRKADFPMLCPAQRAVQTQRYFRGRTREIGQKRHSGNHQTPVEKRRTRTFA